MLSVNFKQFKIYALNQNRTHY